VDDARNVGLFHLAERSNRVCFADGMKMDEVILALKKLITRVMVNYSKQVRTSVFYSWRNKCLEVCSSIFGFHPVHHVPRSSQPNGLQM
jgi:hypothetical protein